MKLIALPDLHEVGTNYLPSISDQLAEVDCIVLVGDLTNGGRETEAKRVIQAVQAFNPSVLALVGNWDRQEVDTYLTDRGINLHRQRQLLDGFAFVGVGGALPSIGQTPTEFSELTFQSYLIEASNGLDPQIPTILVSHQPPINTLNDTGWNSIHLGSESIRAFIEQAQPLLVLTGHIHEGVGIDTIGSTQIINPGPLWQGRYAYIEIVSGGDPLLQIRQCPIVN
jgi:Icc-related predicted phosphoesterase